MHAVRRLHQALTFREQTGGPMTARLSHVEERPVMAKKIMVDGNRPPPKSLSPAAKLPRSTRSPPPRRWASGPTSGAAKDQKNLWGTVPTSSRCSPRRRRRRRAWRADHRRAHDDLHGVAGPAADDPQHVQDRRRADAHRLPRHRPRAGLPGPLDLRRPLRRDGLPPDRLRHAGLQQRPGSHGHGADRPCRDPRGARALPPLSSTASAPRTRSRRSTRSTARRSAP
jgi:hypothetical protein